MEKDCPECIDIHRCECT